MHKLLTHIFLILTISTICSIVSAAEMSSKRDCVVCHIMWMDDFRLDKETLIEWQPGNVLMADTQGVVSSEEICYSCHDGYIADSREEVWENNGHKTFVKPSDDVEIPSNLTLSNKGEIYCGTCHSAHGAGAAPKNNSSGMTSFFREKNIDSSLCEMCHKDQANYTVTDSHPVHTTALKLPDALFVMGSTKGTKRNMVICQSCHKTHGAKGDKITVGNNKSSQLCVACHEKQKSLIKTKHDLNITMAKEKNFKGQSLNESGPCGACHTPHSAFGKKLWARKPEPGDPASQMCLSCHDHHKDYNIKNVGKYSHPIDSAVSIKGADTRDLPLFLKNLKQNPKGSVHCATCHDVHRWNPSMEAEKGEKGIDGDASNSFLRISNHSSSSLCLRCHVDKKQVVTSDHNLGVTAPQEKNLQGFTTEVSGPCGACHLPHNALSESLWAKNLEEGKDFVTEFCEGCHNKDGCAKSKLIGDFYHPVDVSLPKEYFTLTMGNMAKDLPLYDDKGKVKKGGKMVCLTCHEPHTWDPKKAGFIFSYKFKNMDGDSTTSFLRKANFPSSELCKICHSVKALVDGTEHDLNVTAPTAVNLLGQTVSQSGQCGTCHLVHNSPNKLKLWARPYGKIDEDESNMDALCRSCHAKGDIGEKKVPNVANHPKGKLINNIIRFKAKSGYTVIYSLDGKEKNYGDISCPSCHDAHRWSFFSNKKGIDKNREGNAKDSFLRNMSYKNVCKDCHGLDALFKYRYFHQPDKRGVGSATNRN